MPLTFDTPGPGLWSMNLTHFPRPLSALYWDVAIPGSTRGVTEAIRRVGTMTNVAKRARVQRYCYSQDAHLFEKELVAGITRSDFGALLNSDAEALRRRVVTHEFFANRSWRSEEERWRTKIIPQQLATNLELIDIEPRLLTDSELARHLDRAVIWMGRCAYVHHILNLAHSVPVGDFIDAVAGLTGADARSALDCLRGWSPASRNAAWRELGELSDCLESHPEALVALGNAGAVEETLAELQGMPDPVGTAATRYVRMAAFRTIGGFDVADVCAFERPQVVLAGLTEALKADPLAQSREMQETEEHTQRLRNQAPQSARAEFDDRLTEARLVYHIKDERGVYNNSMANALVRRAVLELGERLASRGFLADASHAAELGANEIRLASGEKPVVDGLEMAARFQFRHEHDYRHAPPTLGTALWQAPPPDWYSGDTQRLVRALAATMQAMRGTLNGVSQHDSVSGVGASRGSYEGPVRVVIGAADLEKIEPGDVMVAVSTNPGYSAILPLIGAVITDHGGPFSHAAIVAREYGIPAVVGCGNATAVLADGDVVRVDGESGFVAVLRRSRLPGSTED